ncbi:clathrin light chain A-like isoform X2 [Scleropages formosus]|uniref:clathrin light chain A-like isoform X2 n=1 Tax=Scleropages formosus TaxID=113540 RepID=UPI0010FABCB6|nr:clathrin light chain A-like isoform X2 [Scleropages formosus]
MDDFGNGVVVEEDPAAAFLAQQESEIAGIESDEGLGVNLADGVNGAINGESQRVSNGPSDAYAALAQVERQPTEPESLRRWREEQLQQLEALDARSRTQEVEWKDRAKVELEEWYSRQDEQLEKIKANNRTHINHPCYRLDQAAEEAVAADGGGDESDPGTEWQRVARLCDFSPKSSKQAKDVSRMRSVLISLKQTPLVH